MLAWVDDFAQKLCDHHKPTSKKYHTMVRDVAEFYEFDNVESTTVNGPRKRSHDLMTCYKVPLGNHVVSCKWLWLGQNMLFSHTGEQLAFTYHKYI